MTERDYTPYPQDYIQALSLTEAVRKRPLMYFASFTSLPYRVLIGFLLESKGPAKVTLLTAGRCNVELSGALPIGDAQILMTQGNCQNNYRPYGPYTIAINLANAVCADADLIIITKESQRYFQFYSRGVPTSELELSKLSLEAEPDTTIIKFRIDPEICPGADFNFEKVADAISAEIDIPVTLFDARTGRKETIGG